MAWVTVKYIPGNLVYSEKHYRLSSIVAQSYQPIIPSKESIMTTANSSLTPRTEIVFIESNVADYASLIAGLDPSLEVHVLDATGDGIAQMADILAERSGIDAIHLISHGSAGAVQLGTVTLDEETLQSRRAELETIGKSLSEDGDLLLYGCNVAQGQSGIDFIGKLAQATHADVAGSKNATGESSNGGDWILETSVGGIETHSLSADYSGSLSVVNFDFQNEVTADGVPGLSPGDATSASQTVDGNTLTLSANGKVLVCDDQVYYGYNSANLNGNIFAIDGNWDTTSSLTLSLDSGKIFDLTSFNVQDQSGPGLTLRLTTSKGSVTQAVTADGDAQIYAFNDSKLQGVSSVTITKENSGTFLISLDEIKLENITLPNSAPVFTGLNGGSTYTENGSAVVIDNNVTVADTELDALNGSIGNYNGASLTIARNGGANAQDVFGNTGSLGTLTQGQSFTYNGTSVGTVSTNSGGTLVLTFNTNATSTMVDSVLQSITYSNSSEAPPASVTLNWSFSDGSLSTNGAAGVNITSVNDNPIITAGGTTAFTEQTATAIAPAITITDPDGDTGWNGGTLTVQITGNASADDSLRLPTSNPGTGIWVDGIGTNYLYSGATHIGTASASTVTAGSVWTFTFNANATNALVQDVARAVQFGNDSNDPSTVNRTVTFIATDNGGLSNSATQTVQVSPVNDAPVVTNRSDPGLVFSGVNTSYASFPDIDNSVTESFTLETWVKFSSLSDAYAVQFIAGKGAPGSVEQMELHTNGNALRFIPTGGPTSTPVMC